MSAFVPITGALRPAEAEHALEQWLEARAVSRGQMYEHLRKDVIRSNIGLLVRYSITKEVAESLIVIPGTDDWS